MFSHTSWSSCCLLAGPLTWGSTLGGLAMSRQAGRSIAAMMKRDLNKVRHFNNTNENEFEASLGDNYLKCFAPGYLSEHLHIFIE